MKTSLTLNENLYLANTNFLHDDLRFNFPTCSHFLKLNYMFFGTYFTSEKIEKTKTQTEIECNAQLMAANHPLKTQWHGV